MTLCWVISNVVISLNVGEAIVHAAFGPLSTSKRDFWTTPEEEFKADVDASFSDDVIGWLLTELIEKQTTSMRPNIKQASCLWLLALLKNGMKSSIIGYFILASILNNSDVIVWTRIVRVEDNCDEHHN